MNPSHKESEKKKAIQWAKTVLEKEAVIVDFETTGLRDAEIVQIGIINTNGDILMDTLVKPIGTIPNNVIAIHGITNEMVADAPAFKDIYAKFSSIMAGKVAVAYNSGYEENVLKGVCERRKLPIPRLSAWSCAMKAYASYWGQWNKSRRSFAWQKLGTACKQQNIEVINAHNAIADCQMTLALIQAIARNSV